MDRMEGRTELEKKLICVVENLISTVELTGGVSIDGEGAHPVGDPDWVDIGDAYVEACHAVGRKVKAV